jgi:uncharacterized protein (TIGR00369 family)
MCFLCGRENPIGLNLAFYENPEAEQVQVDFQVPDTFQGYPGIVHGGIVAAVLDEIAGRAVMLNGSDDTLMATLRLTIRYRHPTPTETPLKAVGWVERMGGRGAKVAGEIRLSDGSVTAECEALLVGVPDEFRDRWKEEQVHWKVDE